MKFHLRMKKELGNGGVIFRNKRLFSNKLAEDDDINGHIILWSFIFEVSVFQTDLS